MKRILLLSIFFLLSLHCFYKYVGVYKHLHKRPCSVHSWAQCERASIALNYYQESMNFFKPRIHKELDGEGITGLEFPFVNYSVAILYKLFGFKEFYYKTFVLATLVLGLLLFARLVFTFTGNYILSIASVLTAYFSPVLIYYSANFLPDTTSLGFVLAAWFFIFRYFSSGQKKHLYLFFVLALLAALVKITSLIVFGVVIGLVVLERLKFFHKVRNGATLVPHKGLVLVLCFSAVVIVFGWYKYASWLSETYHSDAFLLSQKIVTDKKVAKEVWEYIVETWVPHYYTEGMYHFIVYVCIFLIVAAKFVSRVLFSVLFLTVLGSCCFVYLMFYQFRNHDYYIITLLPCIFLLFLTFADCVNRMADNYFPPLRLLALFVFLHYGIASVNWCRQSYTHRHDSSALVYTGDFRVYEDLEPKLRSLGIKHEDITLSAFDYTYCNTLYLMNQKGWTMEKEFTKEFVDWVINNRKAKYMVLNDSATFNKIYPNNFKDQIIGYHRGLLIYKIR